MGWGEVRWGEVRWGERRGGEVRYVRWVQWVGLGWGGCMRREHDKSLSE